MKLDTPDIWPVCFPYWDAFALLSPRRPVYVGMGVSWPGPLVYTEIAAFGKDRGFSEPDDLLEFVTLVHELDQEYLLLQSEQRKSTSQT